MIADVVAGVGGACRDVAAPTWTTSSTASSCNHALFSPMRICSPDRVRRVRWDGTICAANIPEYATDDHARRTFKRSPSGQSQPWATMAHMWSNDAVLEDWVHLDSNDEASDTCPLQVSASQRERVSAAASASAEDAEWQLCD
eukprot:2290757-Pyramimonas_sp.AAC.1